LCSSEEIIRVIKSRRMRCTGHVAHIGEMRNACRNLAGKPEGKRPRRRHRRKWEDNIKEEGYDGVGWIHLAHDRDQWWDSVNLRTSNLR
jgi:hypothetical protein